MSQVTETVAVVFMQTSLHSWEVIKVFKDTKKAEKYCKEQNRINQPEFDSYGYCSGVHMFHSEMKVE